jgi:uncharacterized protein (TIGR02246 family)
MSAMLGVALLVGTGARADDAKAATPDEKTLKERSEAFIKAFDDGDAKALAAFWTTDGDYIDQAGHVMTGRDAIEAAFKKQFAAVKGAKLRINTTSQRIKGDLCISDGTTEIIYPNDEPPTGARFTAVLVKQDGQWLLASVRDAVLTPGSNNEHLQELEWLVGDWTGEAEKGEMAKASYSWAENDNFLVSSFAVTLKDVPVAGGTQWIGWDAAAKNIRSWTFTSNGGFHEGVWSHDGNTWTIKVTATTPDGKKGAATVTITKVDDDHLTWQSTKRTLDGQPAPDSDVVKMKRVK